jgi:hypothetical protein
MQALLPLPAGTSINAQRIGRRDDVFKKTFGSSGELKNEHDKVVHGSPFGDTSQG